MWCALIPPGQGDVYYQNTIFLFCSQSRIWGRGVVFLDYANILFLIEAPLALPSFDDSCLNQPPLWWLPNDDLSIYITPLLLLISILRGEAFPSPPRIYPFIYISVNSWTPILFNGLSPITTITYFDTKIVPDFGGGQLFQAGSSITLTMSASFVTHFLTFTHKKMVQTHRIHSLF